MGSANWQNTRDLRGRDRAPLDLEPLPADFGTTIPVDKPDGAFFGGRRPGHVEQEEKN